MKKKGVKPELLHTYQQVFNEDFNLAFFKRKKDKCSSCNAMENLNIKISWKRLIFREQDLLKTMNLEEVMKYDIDKIDLLRRHNGKKEVLPLRV